jgi:YggT family protein
MRTAQFAVKRGSQRIPGTGFSTAARNAPLRARPGRLRRCRRPSRVARAPWLATGSRMHAVLNLFVMVIGIYIWLLIAQAILSWLLAFGVVNRYNRAVAVIGDFLYRITEPALRPIRSFLPNFGGIDISPIVLILILYFLRDLIIEDVAPHLLY